MHPKSSSVASESSGPPSSDPFMTNASVSTCLVLLYMVASNFPFIGTPWVSPGLGYPYLLYFILCSSSSSLESVWIDGLSSTSSLLLETSSTYENLALVFLIRSFPSIVG